MWRGLVYAVSGNGKSKGYPVTDHEAPELDQMYNYTLWSTLHPGRFTHGKYPVPIVIIQHSDIYILMTTTENFKVSVSISEFGGKSLLVW